VVLYAARDRPAREAQPVPFPKQFRYPAPRLLLHGEALPFEPSGSGFWANRKLLRLQLFTHL